MVFWRTAYLVFYCGTTLLTIATLALMLAVRTVIDLVIDLSSIFAAKTKITSNLLQGCTVFYHHIKAFKSVRAIFFFEFPLEFVSWLDMEFVAPVRYRRGPYIEQTSNLSISEGLNLYLFTDKLFYTCFIDFHCNPWLPLALSPLRKAIIYKINKSY